MCDIDLLLCLGRGGICRLHVVGLPMPFGAFSQCTFPFVSELSRVTYLYLLTSKGQLRSTCQRAMGSCNGFTSQQQGHGSCSSSGATLEHPA